MEVGAYAGGVERGDLGVALALQPTLATLFAAVTIFVDRPFQLGDGVSIAGVSGSIGSAPLHERFSKRVEEHLASLDRRLQRSRRRLDRETIGRRIRRIQSTDVVLPLADEPGRELRICCVVRPDKTQAMLLDRLGLRLPERLRAFSHVIRM